MQNTSTKSRVNPLAVHRFASALYDFVTELAASFDVSTSATPTHYVTSQRGPFPPGKSARWARRNLRHIPGAQLVGRDWRVSVADFDAWVASKQARPAPSPANDFELAATLLRAAGMRGAR